MVITQEVWKVEYQRTDTRTSDAVDADTRVLLRLILRRGPCVRLSYQAGTSSLLRVAWHVALSRVQNVKIVPVLELVETTTRFAIRSICRGH